MKARGHAATLIGSAISLLGLTIAGAIALADFKHGVVVGVMLAESLVIGILALLIARRGTVLATVLGRRNLLLLLFGTAVLMRLALLPAPPLSTDIYRYIWDGRVQAAGINPYRYVPDDPMLAKLRDPNIWPSINRAATAHTIYPPTAQAIFLAATRIAETVPVMKAVMTGFDLVTVWAIVMLLRRRGLPEAWALLYAWNPLPVFEFSGSGHVDAVAIALMMLAALFADKKRPGIAGAILGAATLVKYFPAVIAPALYQRWDWRMPVAMLAAIVLLYLPYLSAGTGVFGFLGGYAHEEGLTDNGGGFFLLAALSRLVALPSWASHAYLLAGLAALGVIAVAALLRPKADGIALGAATALVLAFTLILSPHLNWYFAWVLPFACLRPRASLLWLTGASPLIYGILWHADRVVLEAAVYVPFALLFLIETLGRPYAPVMEVTNGHRLGTPAD